MKFLRRMLAWLLFWLGAISLALWATASYLTHKVDNGSIATPLISSVLHQQRIQDMIANQAQSLVADELTQNGVPITGTPQEQVLNDEIAKVVNSDDFIDDLTDIIAELESRIVSQLTDDTLPLAPLVITFDVTEPLYNALAGSPEIAALVPSTALEPITIDPLDVDEVANVRGWYDWVQFASQWGLWIGLGLFVLGFIVLPGKRWIIPKILLGLGITVLIGWFLASKLTTAWVLDRLGEEAAPEFRESVAELIPQSRIDDVQSDLLKYAILLLVLAAVAYALVFLLFRKRKPKGEAEAEPELDSKPAPAPAPAPTLAPTPAPEPAPLPEPGAVAVPVPPRARVSGELAQEAGVDVIAAAPPVGAVVSTPPVKAMPPSGATPLYDADAPVVSTESAKSSESVADHKEPGSTPKKEGKPTGPTA